jgi:excisionase family DNA binding protein
MPENLNLTQAARLLNVSDKTLRGWLNAGRFPGAKRLINGNWSIPKAEIEAYLEMTGNTETISTPGLLKILDMFTQEIDALSKRIEALSEELHKPPPPSPPIDVYSVVSPPRSTGASGNLPPGYVALVSFHHGIPETTVGRWRKADASRASIGDWRDSSGHLVKVALSPDQQRGFYNDFSLHKSFKRCPYCPHFTG